MKKVSIVALALTVGIAASAQMSVVKDTERAIKGSTPDYAAALKAIQPALTNPESANEALTWYVAGKAGVTAYDKNYEKSILGQDFDKKFAASALVDGMGYMLKALPLDSVADAKGKVKTKYSKDIIKQVTSHYNDLNTAGVWFWEAQDYNGAYDAWELYLNLPSDPVLGKNAPQALPDTVRCEIAYNQALAAWQADDLEKALASFERAKSMGYTKKNLYDYAISVAAQLHNNDKVFALSEEAYPLYGSEDSKYLQLMINGKIEAGKYDEALSMLKDAIAADPNNAQLYNVLGILQESQNQLDESIETYRKAVAIDADLAQAQYNLGRQICNKAYAIDDKASSLDQNEYNKVRFEEVNPLFKEASGYLERAYQLDPDNMHDALVYLRNVYYNLGDEENYQRVQNL
ncbi:MAG: tetratricopeptide repeat protein [Muribaculaceae bacterium]|nr:tetratricopeptide repeat protein [Muribaculaceae bacterium]